VADPEDKQSTLCPTHQSCLQHSRDDAMQAVKVYCPHDNHSQHSRGDCIQAVKAGETGDEDIIKLAAEDAELARAKERLTLKHRNSSKWARRALKRGMDVMDEGTKAAVAEQLRLGEELRRKVKTSFESRV